MRNILGKVTPTVAAVAVATVLSAGGGAYAAVSHLGKDSVGTWAIKDGGVKQVDLTPWVQRQLTRTPNLTGYAKQSDIPDVRGLRQQVSTLETEVTDLQAQVQSLQPKDSGWVFDNGSGVITGARTADLTEPDDSVFGASLSNGSVDLPYTAGDQVSVTYTLSNGAKQGWGAPRVVVKIDGTWYSTVGNVSADYGTKNADGSWTENAVPVTGNDETGAPTGTITSIAVVYDNLPAPGTVHVSDLKIGEKDLSFR